MCGLTHDGNPVPEWCLGSVVGHDDAGERLPAQGSAGEQDRCGRGADHDGRVVPFATMCAYESATLKSLKGTS